MSGQQHADILLKLICKDMSLSEDESAGLQFSDQQQILLQLERLIAYLLDHDFNRLINACYRMDIPEDDLSIALHTDDPEKVAWEIANLVFERQMKKVEMRIKYSSKPE